MKMLWKKLTLGLACLPLVGLPGGAGGQALEQNAPRESGRTVVSPPSQFPAGSPRRGVNQTTGGSSPWDRPEANESSPRIGTEAGRLVLHGVVTCTGNGEAGSTSARSPVATPERPPTVPRSLSAEPYAYRYGASVPSSRAGYAPVSRCLPACSEAVGETCLRGVGSGLRRIGAGLAALFGLGAYGASRNRKES